MANTLTTIDMVTREALRVAHESLSFLGTVDRSYDSSYAKTGAKVGAGASILTGGTSLNVPAGTLLETALRVPMDIVI